ncbi:MAG: right-handed parallel beta-helix repeat-containing protein [Bacteroidales bacterium]
MKNQVFKVVSLCFFLLLGNLVVRSQVLMVDNFDYPVGQLLTDHGWSAHASGGSNPVDVTSGLSFSGYLGSGVGGAANLDNSGEDDSKTFAMQSTGTVYVSFIMQAQSSNFAGNFLHLSTNPLSTSYFFSKVWVNATGTGVGLGLGIDAPLSYSPITANTPTLLVLKYDIATKISSLFVFNILPASEPATANSTVTETLSITNVGSVALRQYAAAERVIVDGIRIGNTWSDIMAAPPTSQSSEILTNSIERNQFSFNWTDGNGSNRAVFMKQNDSLGTAAPTHGVTYTANTNFGDGSQIGTTGWYCVYNGSSHVSDITVSGLLTYTNYRIMVCEYNGEAGMELYNTSEATANPITQKTLALLAPAVQATNVIFNNITTNQYALNWTPGNGEKRAVFIKHDSLGAASPINDSTYIANTSFGAGSQIGTSGWYCVYNGSTYATQLIISELLPGTKYRIMVCEYNGAEGSEKYNSIEATNNPLTVSTITLLPPSTQASNITFNNVAPTQFSFNWTDGNGSKRAVFMKQDSLGTALPVNFTSYTANTAFGDGTQIGSSGWYCVYNGTEHASDIAVTGLIPNMKFRIMVCEYDGEAGSERYNTSEATGNPMTQLSLELMPPTLQASNILVNNVGTNQFSFNWTDGNGSKCVVFMTQDSLGTALPENNAAYTASTSFGEGTQIGTTGWYCVFNGTSHASDVTVTGLLPNLKYRLMVCEYDGNTGYERYNTTEATNNPVNQQTLELLPPTLQASNIAFTEVASTQMTFNWVDGNGDKRAVFMKQDLTGAAIPENNISYAANTIFGNGTQIGISGWFCVFNGTTHASGITVTGLAQGTQYRIMVCEYDGNTGFERYNTTEALDNPLTQNTCTIVPGGEVSGTWTLSGSPYLINGSIHVPNATTLSIEPGVMVNFQGMYKIYVQGRVLALGTESDSITFTAANTTNGWRGVRFDAPPLTNDTSRFSYCKFLYGKATAAAPDNNGGVFYFRNYGKTIISNSRISNCLANANGGGIYLENSAIKILNTNIENNESIIDGGGIYAKGSDIYLQYCSVKQNISNSHGGGISIYQSLSPMILNNNISYNSSQGYGGGIYSNSENYSSTPTISGNTINFNTVRYSGGGIAFFYSRGAIVTNNNITYNSTTFSNTDFSLGGGGVILYQSNNVHFTNNVINYNSSQSHGGGLLISGVNHYNYSNVIKNNQLLNNSVLFESGCGGGIAEVQTDYWSWGISFPNLIIANEITNCYAIYGGGIYSQSVLISPIINNINNNVISNCNAVYGGAIYFKTASPIVTNNTLANNNAEYGGAMFCSTSSYPIVSNTILWGNTATISGPQVYLNDELCDPILNYNIIQGGIAAFGTNDCFYAGQNSNTIDLNPLFVLPSAGSGTNFDGLAADWSLQYNSPCLNAGDPEGIYPESDIAGNPRVDGATIDIGAYELISFVASLQITQPIICFGTTTGALSAIASGGTPPYTYLWNTGQTTADLTDIEAGTYSVTVSDATDIDPYVLGVQLIQLDSLIIQTDTLIPKLSNLNLNVVPDAVIDPAIRYIKFESVYSECNATHVIEIEVYDNGVNVALNKYGYASGYLYDWSNDDWNDWYNTGGGGKCINDGNYGSEWISSSSPAPSISNPSYIIIDLGQEFAITNLIDSIRVVKPDCRESFSIKTSNDNNHWKTIGSEINKSGTFNYYISHPVGQYTYLWSSGETTPGIMVTPSQSTTYYLTLSYNNVSCTDSVNVYIQPSLGELNAWLVDVNDIHLEWNEPLEVANLTAYNLYRNNSLLVTLPVTSLEFDDMDLDNGTYNYSLTAVYENVESTPTPEVQIVVGITNPAPVTTIASVTASINTEVILPVTVTGFTNITAVSLQLDYDPYQMTYTGYANANAQLSDLILNDVADYSSGYHRKIMISWSDETPKTIPSGGKILDLNFTYIQGNTTLSWNNSVNSGSNCEYADASGNPLTDVPSTQFYYNGEIIGQSYFTISGNVWYHNYFDTAIDSALVSLYQGGNLIKSDTANLLGQYVFDSIPNGMYSISAATSKPWQGVNGTDALKIQRHFAELEFLSSPVRIKAADVNLNNSVNATDAVQVKRRFASLSNSFARGDWTFADPNGYTYFYVNNSNVVQNLYGLCVGDVNGSNIPEPGAFILPQMVINTEGLMEVLPGQEFDLSITVQTNITINALSLVIPYPEDYLEVLDVLMENDYPVWNTSSGEIRIAWSEMESLILQNGDALITLKLRAKDNFTGEKSIRFIATNESELADGHGERINGVELFAPSLSPLKPNGIDNVGELIGSCKIFPNPANERLTIEFTLKSVAEADISLFDAFGKEVRVYPEISFINGLNTFSFETASLHPGLYNLKLHFVSDHGQYQYIKKIIINR